MTLSFSGIDSWPSSETQGPTCRDKAIFLGERHFWRESLLQGLKISSPWALFLTKRVPEVFEVVEKYFSGQSAGLISTTSGTHLVRRSAQRLFSPWSKLRSPENIASSRLVAPLSPGIILDRLITTSVTSHSNEWTLWIYYSDYAIEEGQQRLRKMKKTGLISLLFAN